MPSIKELFTAAETAQDRAAKALETYINNYVDEGEYIHKYSEFTVNDIDYYISDYSSDITSPNHRSCPSMPATAEEAAAMFIKMKHANKCAVQAIMAYRYAKELS